MLILYSKQLYIYTISYLSGYYLNEYDSLQKKNNYVYNIALYLHFNVSSMESLLGMRFCIVK